MKFLFYFLIFLGTFCSDPQIQINNSILTTINDKTISIVDVTKRLNYLFGINYPHLLNSPAAKYQFYTTNWKYMVNEMLNEILLVSEAEIKEIKLNNAEIREEMEKLLGPNIPSTLEQLNLSHDEAWEIIKNDMICKRMGWFFIYSKAIQQITPQMIKQEYRLFSEKTKPKDHWEYCIISTKNKEIAEEAKSLLDKNFPISILKDKLDIQISENLKISSSEASKLYKEILSSLNKNSYSGIFEITNRLNENVYRIFYLNNHTVESLPSFDEKYEEIKNNLIQKKSSEESNKYFSRLRKQYGVKEIPLDLQPFSLK